LLGILFLLPYGRNYIHIIVYIQMMLLLADTYTTSAANTHPHTHTHTHWDWTGHPALLQTKSSKLLLTLHKKSWTH